MEKYLGEHIPKLGFGLMRLPKIGEDIDLEQTAEMVDLFLSEGFCYFDTSRGYPGSEAAAKAALVDRHPRDSYLLATKCPVWAVKTREKAERMIYTSLERTGAGYFDFYLLHNLGENRSKAFDEYDMWNFLARRKEEGLIKHLGFSIHDKADALDAVLTAHPEMEFVQLQINYADWRDPWVESEKCYAVAQKHGKPIVIMEPVKGGRLADPPRQVAEIFKSADPDASLASWALRYAASLEGVITVLSGMSSVEQVRDNVSVMKHFKPLTAEERAVIEQAGGILADIPAIPCTSCGYCMKDCPKSIAIYGIFQAANLLKTYGDAKAAKGSYEWNTSGLSMGKASDCIACGSCEEACPQHISIRDELKKAAADLEVPAKA
ncbi:MAG: aldo/keto reductase [Clostridiales Family XIII bacterium]|jgi:predicted aldo/keto reductase-like oxidoreductase|nr:aldo/keto reductase [Clostridiales Family XIII bacterium]